MARVRQTVIAVVHGSDEGSGVDVEVYPYAPEIAAGHRAGELVGSWRPQPGELDDVGRVNARRRTLRTAPGQSPAPGARNAAAFLARASEQNLARARMMSGEARGPIYDERYEYEIGEILLFDAEVDTDSMTVDWETTVPHSSVNPQTVLWDGQIQRFDETIIDPQACRDGTHRIAVSADGTMVPFNEAGQPVTGLSAQEKADYISADRSQVPHRGPLLVTLDYGNGYGSKPRLRAEPADSAIRRGTVDMLAAGEGVAFRPADLEAVRLAAGEQYSPITDATGAAVGAVYLVEANYGAELSNGSVVFDALGATNAVAGEPNIGSLTVSGVAGDLRVSASGSRWTSAPPTPTQGAAFVGGNTPVTGIETQLDDRPTRRATPKRSERKALAAVQSRTASFVREHGPMLVQAAKAKLKDPAVQAILRNALLTAVDVGLAGKGGTGKFARAASTAVRLNDMVSAAKQNGSSGRSWSPGLPG